MSTAAEVLTELRAAGLEVKAAGEHLEIRPASYLTDSLRERAREQKAGLLELLSKPLAIVAPSTDAAGVEFEHDGFDCSACANLELLFQWNPQGRRNYYWNCKKGHGVLDVKRGNDQVILSPSSCVSDFRATN